MNSIFKWIYRIFVTLIFIIIFLISIFTGFQFYSARNADLTLKQGYTPIRIYDNNQNLITTDSLYYSYTSILDVSEHILNAFISVEDRTFYSHHGFSTKRIIKSMMNNIFNHSLSQGASTITQQYVKNVFLTNEKTFKRKMSEIAIAFELEKKYTKEQILEAYLNSILFGGNIYGIKMACLYYFHKEPNQITISEAAYLAGMIQAPNFYNAFKNPIEAQKRKNIVLKCMLETGVIQEEDYIKECEIQIKDLLTDQSIDIQSPRYLSSYLDYIYSSIPTVDASIFEIHTYLDLDIQKELYKIIHNDYGLFPEDDLNCAIIVLDNETYGVKAMVGNRISDRRVLNYASDVLLQPGSTIKPILDYAPAFEYLSYGPATLIEDEEYTYSDGTTLHNYDHSYLGCIPLRKALSDSRNIPAVKLFNEVGHNKAFDFARQIGIDSNEIYEADAIGGAKNGYTLLDIANAYQAFANLGYYKEASGISKIVLEQDTIENKDYPKLVMKPTTAWLINNILHDVFKNSSYNLNHTYLMAKTGQTNYDTKTLEKYNIPYGSTKDSLLVAYTKDITLAVWVGYNKVTSSSYLDSYKKNIPRNIMRILMNKFTKNHQYYSIIPGIIKEKITIYDNQVYKALDDGYEEYFVEGTQPLSYPKPNIKI